MSLALLGPPICFADSSSLSTQVSNETSGKNTAGNLAARSKTKQVSVSVDHHSMQLDLRAPDSSKMLQTEVGAANGHFSDSSFGVSANFNELSAGKPMGGVEDFARRVHREGLPVARLLESKSALITLGLNQKGKPGLWLIQKTH